MACPASSSTPGTGKPIVVVGSVNADLVVKVQQLPRPGETIAGSSLDFFPGGKVRLPSPCCPAAAADDAQQPSAVGCQSSSSGGKAWAPHLLHWPGEIQQGPPVQDDYSFSTVWTLWLVLHNLGGHASDSQQQLWRTSRETIRAYHISQAAAALCP